MMLGYTLGGYLIGRTNFSRDVGDNDEGCHDKSPRYGRQRWTISTRHMDESGQGPKRAVAEAVVHLLKIQPGIHSTEDSSSKGKLLGYDAAVKAMPSIQCYGSVASLRATMMP
jgi:hypothetical protein